MGSLGSPLRRAKDPQEKQNTRFEKMRNGSALIDFASQNEFCGMPLIAAYVKDSFQHLPQTPLKTQEHALPTLRASL